MRVQISPLFFRREPVLPAGVVELDDPEQIAEADVPVLSVIQSMGCAASCPASPNRHPSSPSGLQW